MYREANRRACARSEKKSKLIPTVHFSLTERRTLCKKILSDYIVGDADKNVVTCNVCRKTLGLPKIIIEENSIKLETANEKRLRERLEGLNKQLKEVRDQITIAQMLLDSEIERIEKEQLVEKF